METRVKRVAVLFPEQLNRLSGIAHTRWYGDVSAIVSNLPPVYNLSVRRKVPLVQACNVGKWSLGESKFVCFNLAHYGINHAQW